MYYVRVVEVLECGDGELEFTVFYTFIECEFQMS